MLCGRHESILTVLVLVLGLSVVGILKMEVASTCETVGNIAHIHTMQSPKSRINTNFNNQTQNPTRNAQVTLRLTFGASVPASRPSWGS
jgi:hypothetical protein